MNIEQLTAANKRIKVLETELKIQADAHDQEIKDIEDVNNAISNLADARINRLVNAGMKCLPTSEWHEDLGTSIFISFSRDENGKILGEPPELYYGSGYLEEDFDEEKWTHYIDGNFNFIFEDADPVNFPKR